MIIMSVETSCDETAVAITRDGREILADEIFSQVDMHAIYGGVVPEIASRNHIEVISRLADSAISKAGIKKAEIDAVAVTYAPGLIGALLVGLNFAKSAAFALNKPLIPVHHIRGHIAANYLAYPELEPPFLALVASGGHTLIIDVEDYTHMKVLGSTRDDAAGEASTRSPASWAGLPRRKADRHSLKVGGQHKMPPPRAKVDDHPLDFLFSGLKTAVFNIVNTITQRARSSTRHPSPPPSPPQSATPSSQGLWRQCR